jgi:hypothetical protein
LKFDFYVMYAPWNNGGFAIGPNFLDAKYVITTVNINWMSEHKTYGIDRMEMRCVKKFFATTSMRVLRTNDVLV